MQKPLIKYMFCHEYECACLMGQSYLIASLTAMAFKVNKLARFL